VNLAIFIVIVVLLWLAGIGLAMVRYSSYQSQQEEDVS
jgi:uncharacterized membrane protein YdbT with pleckstrin-like domain